MRLLAGLVKAEAYIALAGNQFWDKPPVCGADPGR